MRALRLGTGCGACRLGRITLRADSGGANRRAPAGGLCSPRAELPKLDGSLWHAYRRKWAIERKHLPLKDVAAAGGWKDVNTLLEVYQQSDEESVLAVMSETRKLRERGVA